MADAPATKTATTTINFLNATSHELRRTDSVGTWGTSFPEVIAPRARALVEVPMDGREARVTYTSQVEGASLQLRLWWNRPGRASDSLELLWPDLGRAAFSRLFTMPPLIPTLEGQQVPVVAGGSSDLILGEVPEALAAPPQALAEEDGEGWYHRWMGIYKEVLADLPMRSLTIPGSHDSGTGSLPAKFPFAVTQHFGLKEQLRRGARSLDLRVTEISGQFVLAHDFMPLPLSLDTALDEVAEFLDDPAHADEVVVLDVHRFPDSLPKTIVDYTQWIDEWLRRLDPVLGPFDPIPWLPVEPLKIDFPALIDRFSAKLGDRLVLSSEAGGEAIDQRTLGAVQADSRGASGSSGSAGRVVVAFNKSCLEKETRPDPTGGPGATKQVCVDAPADRDWIWSGVDQLWAGDDVRTREALGEYLAWALAPAVTYDDGRHYRPDAGLYSTEAILPAILPGLEDVVEHPERSLEEAYPPSLSPDVERAFRAGSGWANASNIVAVDFFGETRIVPGCVGASLLKAANYLQAWEVLTTSAHDKLDKVMTELGERLQALTDARPHLATSAKVVASDARSSKARGAILVFAGAVEQVPAANSDWTWSWKTFETDHEYTSDLYQPAADLLSGLSFAQAFYSKVEMTNEHKAKGTLTVWYPS